MPEQSQGEQAQPKPKIVKMSVADVAKVLTSADRYFRSLDDILSNPEKLAEWRAEQDKNLRKRHGIAKTALEQWTKNMSDAATGKPLTFPDARLVTRERKTEGNGDKSE